LGCKGLRKVVWAGFDTFTSEFNEALEAEKWPILQYVQSRPAAIASLRHLRLYLNFKPKTALPDYLPCLRTIFNATNLRKLILTEKILKPKLMDELVLNALGHCPLKYAHPLTEQLPS